MKRKQILSPKEEFPMKRYVSGFLFFLCLTSASLLGLFYMTKDWESEDVKQVQAVETLEHPAFAEDERNKRSL